MAKGVVSAVSSKIPIVVAVAYRANLFAEPLLFRRTAGKSGCTISSPSMPQAVLGVEVPMPTTPP